MDDRQLFEKIKQKNLENRVVRPGFFQSKQIVCEAVNQGVKLTENIMAPGSNIFWVNDLNAYDEDHTQSLCRDYFPKAFAQNPEWTKDIFDRLEQSIARVEDFKSLISDVLDENTEVSDLIKAVREYVNLLIEIQKYYVIAVPLTNYCEQVLRDKDPSMLEYAVQYQDLEVDRMNESLRSIKNSSETDRDVLIEKHLQNFAWIKTNYNIVEEYTRDEVLSEIQSEIHTIERKPIPKGPNTHIVLGLQIGIYLRNRMKEVSQQIWFTYDGLAKSLAKKFGISREDFLQMHYREIVDSLKEDRFSVSEDLIKARGRGYIVGFLDNKEVVATGNIVDEVFEYLNQVDIANIDSVQGTTASSGKARGKVKVIKNISEIGKLEAGDILVTSMTTPDFVVAMKKAGAIVTDEGGLSCHAAIVSRELGKTCVIGTKVATKVFQDGDMVEVDAEKGRVQKIDELI